MAKYDSLIDLDTDYRQHGTDEWEFDDVDARVDDSEEEQDTTGSHSFSAADMSYDDSDVVPLLLSSGGIPDGTPAKKTILRTVVHEMPPSYMKLSIFSYLCCCWLFGIVAIAKSMEVSDHWANGNISASIIASQKARHWNKLSVMTGVIIYLIIAFSIALKVGTSKEYG